MCGAETSCPSRNSGNMLISPQAWELETGAEVDTSRNRAFPGHEGAHRDHQKYQQRGEAAGGRSGWECGQGRDRHPPSAAGSPGNRLRRQRNSRP